VGRNSALDPIPGKGIDACLFFGPTLETAALGELPITRLHGNMPQQERKDGYKKFCDAKTGLLICTDVAARGLHLPHVNLYVVGRVSPALCKKG
jgi:superfamily II DNA/RNA helicase